MAAGAASFKRAIEKARHFMNFDGQQMAEAILAKLG
jgi:hypothetical protein